MNRVNVRPKTKLYKIEYYMNGKIKETINGNSPTNKKIANWKINQLRKSTHKLGKLIPKLVE